MIQMQDFLSALITGATKGQAMSDRTTAEIANIYKDLEILKSFPVPKFSVSTIDMDMAVAILGHKEIPQVKKEHLESFKVDLINFIEKNVPKWSETGSYLMELAVSPESLSRSQWSIQLREHISNALKDISYVQVLDKEIRPIVSAFVAAQTIDAFHKTLRLKKKQIKYRPGFEEENNELFTFHNKLRDSIEDFSSKWWDDFLSTNPQILIEKIPLLAVEPKEIAEIPQDKLVKAKIHLELRPYEWSSMEVEDEKKQKVVKYKLVPE